MFQHTSSLLTAKPLPFKFSRNSKPEWPTPPASFCKKVGGGPLHQARRANAKRRFKSMLLILTHKICSQFQVTTGIHNSNSQLGAWLSGRASALHAEGPGFDHPCLQIFLWNDMNLREWKSGDEQMCICLSAFIFLLNSGICDFVCRNRRICQTNFFSSKSWGRKH